MKKKGYFGTQEPLPKTLHLQAGKLTCLYEKGNLRYIRLGTQEIIRMIYAAVRDKNWLTVPYEIENEVIEAKTDYFCITYTAVYEMNSIRYKADFLIEGKDDHNIAFSMKGEALSTFQRNRIGICIHHPIRECAGQVVQIIQPDGSDYTASFPEDVSPYQPFQNIQQMHWKWAGGIRAQLHFAGDIFETEDQRNWTDGSYKTYSTPLYLPFPVTVQPGETMHQQVVLKVQISYPIPGQRKAADRSAPFQLMGKKFAFPKIGFSRAKERGVLSKQEIGLLQQIPFDHYRVEIRLTEDWQEEFLLALSEAKKLGASLECIAFFGDEVEAQASTLMKTLEPYQEYVSSLLVLHYKQKTTPEALIRQVYPLLKKSLPNIKIGYGTDAYFAELNRNRPSIESFDFVSYSINPQVHASDIRSLIENVEAQQYTVQTAQTFAPGKAIHISPVTLKRRYNPDATGDPPMPSPSSLLWNVDTRQPSAFTAAWTLLSLRYLCKAASITFFETVGMRGIMQGDTAPALPHLFPAGAGDLFPIYHFLKKLYEFKPVWMLDSQFSYPLAMDGIVLENAGGKQLVFEVNFEKSAIDSYLLDL